MKEKRFSFFAALREKEKYLSSAHCTHLQIAHTDPQSKICKRVQFLLTHFERVEYFELNINF
jgi:hypothetical protein